MRQISRPALSSSRPNPLVKSALVGASVLAMLLVAACSSTTPLPQGLSQRMDVAGAQLNRGDARNLVNQFRASRNAPAISSDPGLDQQAQALAQQYAASGNQPAKPEGVSSMRLSAGYTNFAETFSGWRSLNEDANAIADPSARRMGLGVAFSQNSTYGTYWVILLAD